MREKNIVSVFEFSDFPEKEAFGSREMIHRLETRIDCLTVNSNTRNRENRGKNAGRPLANASHASFFPANGKFVDAAEIMLPLLESLAESHCRQIRLIG